MSETIILSKCNTGLVNESHVLLESGGLNREPTDDERPCHFVCMLTNQRSRLDKHTTDAIAKDQQKIFFVARAILVECCGFGIELDVDSII